MIYVISDIHSYYDRYMKILEKINFSQKDTLYILGDVLDRGPDWFKILPDMASRSNVIALRSRYKNMAIHVLHYIM